MGFFAQLVGNLYVKLKNIKHNYLNSIKFV